MLGINQHPLHHFLVLLLRLQPHLLLSPELAQQLLNESLLLTIHLLHNLLSFCHIDQFNLF